MTFFIILAACSGGGDGDSSENENSRETNSSSDSSFEDSGRGSLAEADNSFESYEGGGMDLSGGESEHSTNDDIYRVFFGHSHMIQNDTSYLKQHLKNIYHRIQHFRELDLQTNGVHDSFNSEDYEGLNLIVDKLFENYHDPFTNTSETIYQKIDDLTFTFKDLEGRECFGEYHYINRTPDWRDMSINHRTREICVSLYNLRQTEPQYLKHRIYNILAMETSHLMGLDRREAEKLRNWFSSHPGVVLPMNSSFVELYRVFENIDTNLTNQFNEILITFDSNIACNALDNISTTHEELKSKILYKNNNLNRDILALSPNRLNSIGPNFLSNNFLYINQSEGNGPFEFHHSLIYDVYNPNQVVNYINDIKSEICLSESLNEKTSVLINLHDNLTNYYQTLFEKVLKYQYQNQTGLSLNNSFSKESAILKHTLTNLHLINHQLGEEVFYQNSDDDYDIPNITCELKNSKLETHTTSIDFEMINVLDEDTIIRYDVSHNPWMTFTTSHNEALIRRNHGAYLGFVKFNRILRKYTVGIYPHSPSYSIKYAQSESNYDVSVFDLNPFFLSSTEIFGYVLYEEIPDQELNSSIYRVDNNFSLVTIDENNPEARIIYEIKEPSINRPSTFEISCSLN